MSTAAAVFDVPDRSASPAASFSSVGRVAAAGTLVAGAAFQLAAFLTMPSYDHTIDRLRWVADHPTQAGVSKVCDILAMPFLFGTALVYVLLTRRASPRLAYLGGILLGCGMVGLTASQGLETLEFSLAQDGRFDLAALADKVDNISGGPIVAILLLFIPGAVFGLLTFTVALWRSRAVPRGAVLLLPVFLVLDIALQQGVIGHAVALVGAAWIATAILRTPAAAHG
jgi:hypothetical protein